MILTVLPDPSSSWMWRRAPRTIDELKEPHKPRSAVATMTRWTASAPVPASIGGAAAESATDSASVAIIRSMRSA